MNVTQPSHTPSGETPEVLLQRGIQRAQSGAVGEAIELFRQLVEMAPQNPDGWNNLATLHCCRGEIDDGIECYERALGARPGHPDARKNLARVLGLRMNQALKAHDHEQQLSVCRRILELDPTDFPARVNLHDALCRLGRPARLSDFAGGLAPEQVGRKIFVACMPKSGSSWLLGALTGITGFDEDRYTQGFLQNEQEVYPDRVIQSARENGVIQQHARATAPNVHLLQAFGIRPVVLVRNLFDALVSLHDFYDNGAVRNTFHYADWDDLDAATRLDLLCECVAPWYVQFYASWALADREKRLPVHWMSYETMMADKQAALAGVLDFVGIPAPAGAIEDVVGRLEDERGKTRFNKGVSGRGEQTFSAGQMDRVRRLARYYPSIDFSLIGL